jgi:hypothetical protein
MNIELKDFLKWAFGEELVHVAKDGGSLAWSHMASYAVLGTVVDTFGIGGAGLPDIADVHPDAIAANDAVMLLAAEKFDLPEGWNPFPELDDPHGLIAACVEEVLARRALRYSGELNNNLIGLVIAFSVMGKEPEWRVEQPKFRMVERAGRPAWFVHLTAVDAFGREYAYEADGYNAKSGRPKKGAFRKYEFSDPFQGAVQARIDWYLWSKAVTRIAERLKAGLKAHQIKPFHVDCEIWLKQADFAEASQAIEKA